MPNPFFFAGKITNPEQFVGREKELKKIFSYLDVAQTGQIQHISVVGERRIGKSSLLYHISQTYQKHFPTNGNYRFIYLDLQNPHCHTMPGLLNYILEQLDLPALQQPALTAFYDSLEQAHEKKKVWIVLLMDEFEYLTERNTDFPDEFYNTFRSLGGNNIIGIVTASQHPLQSLKQESKLTSNFFNIFHQIDLKEFSEIEANALLHRGQASDEKFSEDDCEQIIKIAGKHPAKLQVVSSLVYEAKANGKVDWKVVKAEAIKEPPFTNGNPIKADIVGWTINILKWLFITLPRMIGRAFLDFIGRDKAADTTAWIFGAIILIVAIGFVIGIVPWPIITKYVKVLLGLVIK